MEETGSPAGPRCPFVLVFSRHLVSKAQIGAGPFVLHRGIDEKKFRNQNQSV